MKIQSGNLKQFHTAIMPFWCVINITFSFLLLWPACVSSGTLSDEYKLDVSILFNLTKCKAKPECGIGELRKLFHDISTEKKGDFWLIRSGANGVTMVVRKNNSSDHDIVAYAHPGKAWNILDLMKVFGEWSMISSSKTYWIVFELSSDWTKGFPVNVYAELSLPPENDAAPVVKVKIRTVSD